MKIIRIDPVVKDIAHILQGHEFESHYQYEDLVGG